MRRVVLVAVGPEEHGVTRHALQTAALAESVLARQWDVELVRCSDADEFAAAGQRLRTAAAEGAAVHVDVTDALFGADPAAAVAVLREVLPATATLALHDVPQPAEGAARYAARAQAYAELAGAFAGVVVASEHEAGFLRRACAEATGVAGDKGTAGAQGGDEVTGGAGVEPAPIAVVPLPVPDERVRAAERTGVAPGELPRKGTGPVGGIEGLERDVVVLGHLYPGKGHAEAVAALAAVRAQARKRGDSVDRLPSRVTALGPVAAGHDDLVAELEQAAAAEGLEFRVTGFVPDELLPAALEAAAVPFAAHRNVSASGSLATWMGHGRRAIVPAGAYVDEMDALRPGTLHVARPGAPGATADAEDRGRDDTGATTSGGTVTHGDVTESTVAEGTEDGVLAALTQALAAAVVDPSLTRLAPDVSLAPTPEDTVRALAEVWARALHDSDPEATTVEGGGRDD